MLGLATGIGMMMMVGAVNPAVTPELYTSSTVVDQPITLEDHVRESFKDTPVMAEIARCESQFRQFNKDGTVLRGMAVKKDVGLFQINEGYHAAAAKALGLNIYSVDGNMAYAKVIFEKSGTQPWKASKPCWGKSDAALALAK